MKVVWRSDIFAALVQTEAILIMASTPLGSISFVASIASVWS